MRAPKGFTVTEVLIGATIMTVLIAIFASIISWVSYTFQSKRDLLETEEVAARAEFLLRHYFSQAVDVDGTGTIPLPANLGGGTGKLVNFASPLGDRIGGNPVWTALAVFHREIQASGAAFPNHGLLGRMAIWYRRPEAGPPSTSGVLFFDPGGARILPSTQPAPTIISPSYADQYIDRISFLQITRNLHPVYNQVTSIDVHIRFRYHTKISAAETWCPQLNITGPLSIPGCNVGGPVWHDLDKRFTILLRNNTVRLATDVNMQATTGVNVEEHVLGNLYFFQPIIPGVQ